VRDIFYIKCVRYAVFLAIYIININSPNVFAVRKKCQIFYKFHGVILRIFSRNLQLTRPNARKNHRKFYARSVRFAQLYLGRGLSWS